MDGPWAWPSHERRCRIRRRGSAALTIAPAWGVSAAPSRPVPFGRGGPWEEEARDVEIAYGPDRTIHVSLEEFARTVTSRGEMRERLREGGVAARALPARLRAVARSHEVESFQDAFRTFRAFDRPNVLHLFATLRPDRAFAREFPTAVQTGPLWPTRYGRGRTRHRSGTRREWVWYASPASAEKIAPAIVEGLRQVRPEVRLYIRSPRPWRTPLPHPPVTMRTRPLARAAWSRRFATAELRIVTGSRTLLEAIELGGPFLYFNGALGDASRRRRHRPEKILAILDVGRDAGVARPLLRDLADFARGRRVSSVVERAALRSDGWARFPRVFGPRGFDPGFDDAGTLVLAVARALARSPESATAIVAAVRSGTVP